MEETMKHVEKLLVAIPLSLYALGLLVHNMYLVQYDAFDYDFVQARYALSGLSTVFIFSLMAVFAYMGTDFSRPYNNFKPRFLIAWLGRVGWLQLALFASIGPDHEVIPRQAHGLFSHSAVLTSIDIITALSSIVAASAAFHCMFFTVYPKERALRLFNGFLTLCALPLWVVLVTISVYHHAMRGIVILTIMLIIIQWFRGGAIIDQENGIRGALLHLGTDANSQELFRRFASPVFTCISILFMIKLYSTEIYPNIAIALGGARPSRACVTTIDGEAEVMIINEDAKWLVVQDSLNHIVKKIAISEIKHISYEDPSIAKHNKSKRA